MKHFLANVKYGDIPNYHWEESYFVIAPDEEQAEEKIRTLFAAHWAHSPRPFKIRDIFLKEIKEGFIERVSVWPR